MLICFLNLLLLTQVSILLLVGGAILYNLLGVVSKYYSHKFSKLVDVGIEKMKRQQKVQTGDGKMLENRVGE